MINTHGNDRETHYSEDELEHGREKCHSPAVLIPKNLETGLELGKPPLLLEQTHGEYKSETQLSENGGETTEMSVEQRPDCLEDEMKLDENGLYLGQFDEKSNREQRPSKGTLESGGEVSEMPVGLSHDRHENKLDIDRYRSYMEQTHGKNVVPVENEGELSPLTLRLKDRLPENRSHSEKLRRPQSIKRHGNDERKMQGGERSEVDEVEKLWVALGEKIGNDKTMWLRIVLQNEVQLSRLRNELEESKSEIVKLRQIIQHTEIAAAESQALRMDIKSITDEVAERKMELVRLRETEVETKREAAKWKDEVKELTEHLRSMLDQLRSRGAMEIFVYDISLRKQIALDVDSSFTIGEVKALIERKTGTAVGMQMLYKFESEDELRDIYTLADYGVKMHNTLRLRT